MPPLSLSRQICASCRLSHSGSHTSYPLFEAAHPRAVHFIRRYSLALNEGSGFSEVDLSAGAQKHGGTEQSPAEVSGVRRQPRFRKLVAKDTEHLEVAQSSPTTMVLKPHMRRLVEKLDDFRVQLKKLAESRVQGNKAQLEEITVKRVLQGEASAQTKAENNTFNTLVPRVMKSYSSKKLRELDKDLDEIMFLRNEGGGEDNARARNILQNLSIPESSILSIRSVPLYSIKKIGSNSAQATHGNDATPGARRSKDLNDSNTTPAPGKITIDPFAKAKMREANVRHFKMVPLKVEKTSKVPTLSHDLSRVLFNPGTYHLQDPRSRVWNFDPYLGSLMPVSEFNYEALNKYVTSSEDATLREVALTHDKKYIGSTSSMSGALSHFHFLLSDWRRLNLEHLSRGFKDEGDMFTKIQRGPTAIFLRYKDGVYAVDADKEYDSANILMSLGRSMEKLLTLDKDEFERFRRTEDVLPDTSPLFTAPEAYHYTGLGQFLLRSQLDAHDPRLPGTGMFDLKTRAVAAVRMMIRNHEAGVGYQIKERFGTWESFEREYYDMMRSAFLKYSLQVRMGRMDGIFVAYHNTERLFGFQYVPLSEMDLALHGQSDRTLGDQEFRFSIKLLSDIFDEATTKHPEQSLRFHFEAREATPASPSYMYVFAEPVSDEEILEIQNMKKAEIQAYEQRIFNPPKPMPWVPEDEEHGEEDLAPANKSVSAQDGEALEDSTISPSESDGGKRLSNRADSSVLDNIIGIDMATAMRSRSENESESIEEVPSDADTQATSDPATETTPRKPLLGWKLMVRNMVNELRVPRPSQLKEMDTWRVDYALTPLTEEAARRHYILCKNRRKTCLESPQDDDAAASYYIRRLIDMSRKGAKWRRDLDRTDAERRRVVLYEE